MATTVAAPTEEEIRATIARAWTARYPSGEFPANAWSTGWGDGITGLPGFLFDFEDMRDSEIERLDQLVAAAVKPIEDRARKDAIEALVGALMQYAGEHPDTPRVAREAAPA